MHGRSPVDHDRQVLDATVYRCVGGRVWETLALGHASSYSTPPVESNIEGGCDARGKGKKKAFSPLARGTNEACVPRSAMTLDAANELSRTDTILLPTCALQTHPSLHPRTPLFRHPRFVQAR